MHSPEQNSPLKKRDYVFAYLLAVTSAALTLVIQISVKSPALDIKQMLSIFMVDWLSVLFLALVPYIGGVMLANRYRITHWAYFVIGGALTASIYSVAFINIHVVGINELVPEPSEWQKLLAALKNIVPCGIVAGVSCWLYLNKKIRKAG